MKCETFFWLALMIAPSRKVISAIVIYLLSVCGFQIKTLFCGLKRSKIGKNEIIRLRISTKDFSGERMTMIFPQTSPELHTIFKQFHNKVASSDTLHSYLVHLGKRYTPLEIEWQSNLIILKKQWRQNWNLWEKDLRDRGVTWRGVTTHQASIGRGVERPLQYIYIGHLPSLPDDLQVIPLFLASFFPKILSLLLYFQ